MKALIVVDMQNDFISGALPVPGAEEIIEPMAKLMEEYQGLVLLTACDHPPDHCSFKEYGGTWPTHCVAGTPGAEIHPKIVAAGKGFYPIFYKGGDASIEQYSGFDIPALCQYLAQSGVREVEICGLARNVCVQATADAASAFGYKVNVLEHLCRSV